jgi:hypothetical protein
VSGPVQILSGIALIALPTVIFGGYSLLRLLIGRQLTEFQATWFRAGHAHAGVLLVATLVALDLLSRTTLGRGAVWTVGVLLLAGTLAQSGGFFLHMGVGRPGRWSVGNSLSVGGAVLLTAGLLTTAIAVLSS